MCILIHTTPNINQVTKMNLVCQLLPFIYTMHKLLDLYLTPCITVTN